MIKGAIRRVFSRSELRKKVVEASRVDHVDPNRPRVTKWSRCQECQQLVPSYLTEVDHIVPVVPLDSSLELMTWDDLVNRMWCDDKGLATLCKPCHHIKTKAESKIRRDNKKKARGANNE